MKGFYLEGGREGEGSETCFCAMKVSSLVTRRYSGGTSFTINRINPLIKDRRFIQIKFWKICICICVLRYLDKLAQFSSELV